MTTFVFAWPPDGACIQLQLPASVLQAVGHLLGTFGIFGQNPTGLSELARTAAFRSTLGDNRRGC